MIQCHTCEIMLISGLASSSNWTAILSFLSTARCRAVLPSLINTRQPLHDRCAYLSKQVCNFMYNVSIRTLNMQCFFDMSNVLQHCIDIIWLKTVLHWHLTRVTYSNNLTHSDTPSQCCNCQDNTPLMIVLKLVYLILRLF